LTASKGRFLGECATRDAVAFCAFWSLQSRFWSRFSPFFSSYTKIWGGARHRETIKKNRNPVEKRPARKRPARTFLTVAFFGAAVFFFVAAAALICKANAIFVFDIRGVNAKACEI